MYKYLIEILNEENTVIIPNFGAITVVNRANKEYMFMSYLKYDDGLLTNFIANKENWTKEEAKDLIAKYVHDINITISKGGTYDFMDIGSFGKKDDEIVFENWKEKSYFTQKKDESKTPVEETKIIEELEINKEEAQPVEDLVLEQEVVSPVILEGKTIADKEINSLITGKEEHISVEAEQTDDNSSTEIIIESITETNIEDKVEEEIIEINSTIKEEDITKPLSEEEQWKDDTDLLPLGYKPPQKKKPILEKIEKDKKKRTARSLVIGFVGIITIVGVGFAGFYWENIQNAFNGNSSEDIVIVEQIEQTEPVKPEQSSPTDESEQQETVEPKKEEEIEPVEPAIKTIPKENPQPVNNNNAIDKTQPIQVIAGSFELEENAHKLVAKFKAKNIDAQMIGQVNNLYVVSIGSFATEQAHQTKKDQLNAVGPNWIFRRR